MPFVAYRNPEENELHFISQENNTLIPFLGFDSTGYVFAPFDDTEKAYLIEPNVVLSEKLQHQQVVLEENNLFKPSKTEKLQHINLVKKAIADIASGLTTKIVVSRKEELCLEEFDVLSVFKKMLFTYPNAYVYVWYHPKVGLWLGATPETLLKVEGLVFKTMSLAGTQPYIKQKNVVWGTKELEEQQMVSDFIKKNLNTHVNQLKFSETETVKAGKLLHLRTQITGVLQHKQDLGKLVKLLHPTPAVCGLPQLKSKHFILNHENYSRTFYTGYLGALNMEGKTNLFVNLRCFNIVDNKAVLYVGGGITKDSIPELEWEETVAKSKTIKRVLF